MPPSSDHSRNSWLNVLDGVGWHVGIACLSFGAILPAYVAHLGGGALASSAAVAVWIVGLRVPQVFSSWLIHHRARTRGVLLAVAVLQRAAVLALVVAALFAREGSRRDLVVFFAIHALWSLSTGLAFPIWVDFLGRSLEPAQFGRALGLRNAVSNLGGVAASLLATWLLHRLAFPGNFAATFALGFAGLAAGFVPLLFIRERARDEPPRAIGLFAYLGACFARLREDRDLRRLVTALSLLAAVWAPAGLYLPHALERFGHALGPAERDRLAGLYSFSQVAVLALVAWPAGRAADRFGCRPVVAAGGVAGALAAAAALLAPSAGLYALVFALMGLTLAAFNTAVVKLYMELGQGEARNQVMVAAEGAVAPVILAGTLGSGWLSGKVGMGPVMIATALVMLLGAALMLRTGRRAAAAAAALGTVLGTLGVLAASPARADERRAVARRLVQQAEGHWQTGGFDQAGECWALAAALEPRLPAALGGLARARRARGDVEGARALLEEAWTRSSHDRNVARDLGFLLLRRDPDRAHHLLKRYLRSPPASDPAQVVAVARAAFRHLEEVGVSGPAEVGMAPDALAIPFRVVGRALLVEARIGREPSASFVLDSGTAAVSIERGPAARLRLRPFAEGTSYGLGGAGRIDASLTDLPRLEVGKLELKHVPAYIGQFRTPHEAAGLLPLGLFEGYQVTIDAERRLLLLARRGARRERGAEPAVPLWRVGAHLAVQAAMGGRTATALLDTGSSAHVIDIHHLDELVGPGTAAAARRAVVQGVAGLAEAVEITLPRAITIGGVPVPGGRAIALDLSQASRAAGTRVDALIGAELVLERRVTIDLAGGELWIGGTLD